MSQFNIDKNKYEEALRKSCKKKIEEEKELQVKIDEATATLQKLYKEKHATINIIEDKKIEFERVQLKVDNAKDALEALKKQKEVEETGLQNSKESFEKQREDFKKEKQEEESKLLQTEKTIDDKQVALDNNIVRNEVILAEIRAERDLLFLKQDSIKNQKDALSEKQKSFADKQRKLDDDVGKFNQEKTDFESEKKNLESREEKYKREYAILEKRESGARDNNKKQAAKQIDLDLQEAEVGKREERVDNLIRIQGLRGEKK